MRENFTKNFELIGNNSIKLQIGIALEAAELKNMALPHMLFAGSPGCGKTSTAKEVAKLAKGHFISVPAEALNNYKSILKIVENFNHDNYDNKGNRVGRIKPTILFIDEIHNLSLEGQEVLGIAMENFILDSGKPNKYFWLPYFTVVGATTLAGNLSKPFLDRFKMTFIFKPYTFEESCKIVKYHAGKNGLFLTDKAVRNVARRGRGTPRTMVGFIERIKDFSIVNGSIIINSAIVNSVFKNLGINEEGLTETDLKILRTLYDNEKVGLENLAILTNEPNKTIKDKIEPYLIQQGFMLRSGSGRIITKTGAEYLEEKGLAGTNNGKIAISVNYERK